MKVENRVGATVISEISGEESMTPFTTPKAPLAAMIPIERNKIKNTFKKISAIFLPHLEDLAFRSFCFSVTPFLP